METAGRPDLMLQGLLKLEDHVMAPASKGQLGGADGLVEDLYNALFELPTAERQREKKAPLPKCKSPATRKITFSLLAGLVHQNPANLAALVTRWRRKKVSRPSHFVVGCASIMANHIAAAPHHMCGTLSPSQRIDLIRATLEFGTWVAFVT